MEYNYLVSPFDFDSFDNIGRKQADEYFRWYISQSETRIGLLRAFIDENQSGDVNLDNSPDSLVPLWKWFEDEILFGAQDFAGGSTDFSGEVLKIITDISFYFAEVVIKNNPGISELATQKYFTPATQNTKRSVNGRNAKGGSP